MADDSLPDYEPMLASYHSAFAVELEAMVQTIPIEAGQLILEMACGDGVYTPWLAKRVGDSGTVVGLDVSMAYLDLARKVAQNGTIIDRSRFVAASIDRLPFLDKTFDVVWCAQSLFSLPEPVDAVERMARVVKPGGLVAVLEDDTLHRVMLPWPIEVELAVRTAEWQVLRDEHDHPHKFYVGRNLVAVLQKAGLVEVAIRSFATSRIAPIHDSIRTFVGEYLNNLRERMESRLEPTIRAQFDRLIDPDSADAMLDQPDFCLTVIDHVVWGRVPLVD